MSIDLFREAVKASHNGDRTQAYYLLKELLMGQPRHEMGWLWLSKVSDNPEEQIRALETVLILNPEHKQAEAQLKALRSQTAPSSPTISPDQQYQDAVLAFKNGRRHHARQLLQQIVRHTPTYEKAWLGLSRLSHTTAEQIVALEMALHLNPDNQKISPQLKKLKLFQEDYLALGQAYEDVNQTEKAMAAFQYAARHAPSATERHTARHRAEALAKRQQKEKIKQADAQIKITSPNLTVVRLAFGPLILYLLLLLIQGGLNPLKAPPLLYISGLGVIVGALMTAGAIHTPYHPLWQKLLGPDGIQKNGTRTFVSVVGLLLLFVPFTLLFIVALYRLAAYREALTAVIN